LSSRTEYFSTSLFWLTVLGCFGIFKKEEEEEEGFIFMIINLNIQIVKQICKYNV